ncbi:MAG: MG2 domain-containing protein [Pirellulaceae bacterium]
MKSRKTFGLSLVLITLFAGVVMSQSQPVAQQREQAAQAMKNGNFKDAYEAYRRLALDPENQGSAVANDLTNGIQCLIQLGRVSEFDEFVESAVDAHKEDWRLLQAAALQYVRQDWNLNHGYIIAGDFQRGPHRGGGNLVNSIERDRVRALQLMMQAMPLAPKDDQKNEVANFYLQLANVLLNNRGYNEAWRLQYLTDIDELPDYDEGWPQYRQFTGAAVDKDGNVVFHHLPENWEAAESDGERWRWALEQAVENAPSRKSDVRWQQAEFYEMLYGVVSMQRDPFGWRYFGRPAADDGDVNESGTYALHTLGEDETIAKLATGIKRFKLPDEFNHIRLLQAIVEDANNGGGRGENALHKLAQVFENRRQYPKAAEYWNRSIDKFGKGTNNWKQQRLDQIVGNWGQFEPVSSQPAGEGATVEFRFRNAQRVRFSASPIDTELLLSDVKAYLKSDPNQIDWNQINIGNLGYRLVHENQTKYVKEKAAEWSLDLEPRERHFDKRITVTTPLQKGGAYLLTASVDGGNVSKIVLWVADTAIVRKQLSEKSLYFVADAANGQPIPNANLEFFGYQQKHLGGNRFRVLTTNFAESTDTDGLVTPDPRDLKTDYQWLVIARTPGEQGRFAYLGFQGVWSGRYYDAQYNQVKLFGITDRPVYRPNHEVNYKFWIAQAQYDAPNESRFANRSFTVQINDPKGEKFKELTLETDEYGGAEGKLSLPADATLGMYNISALIDHNGQRYGGNVTFRVEEYKKPEFEVTVDAPSEPVMLGEKITAKIKAKYYFGAPVVNATVKYKVQRVDYSQDWYPHAPWDWCYGRGYWWFAYDYPWYPGWNKWAGCLRPLPPWIWRGPTQPPELVAEQEVQINADGTVDVEIDTAVAKAMHGDTNHKYTITAEVRDESRRTIVGEGNVLVAREPFKVFSWLDRGFYRTGDTIHAHFLAQTLDSKGVQGKGELTLLKITYDPDQKPIETPVQSWPLNTDDEGRADIQIEAAAAGQYRLSMKVTDPQGHTIEGGYIFTIVGSGFDGGEDFRFDPIELIPDKQEYAPGETVNIQINTDRAGATVMLFMRPANGVYLPPKILRLDGKSTVGRLTVTQKDMPNFFIEAVTIAGSEVHTTVREIVVPPEKRILNVEVTPSQQEYLPGEKATVKLRLTELNGENFVGNTAVAIYDKALEYISGGSNVGDIKEFFWKWRRQHQPSEQSSLEVYSQNVTLPNKPGMQSIGAFGATVADDLDSMARDKESAKRLDQRAETRSMARGGMPGMAGDRMLRKGAVEANGLAMAASAPMMADAAPASGEMMLQDAQAGGAAPDGGLVEATVRTNFADTALWVGSVTTNEQGEAEVTLDMPENLSTWNIRVWGMGHGTRVGEGSAEVITRKNLIVRLQSPRFFVQKDEVVLTANVHNYLAEAKDVTVSLEVPGGLLQPIDGTELTVQVNVPADGEQRVDWRVKVVEEGTAIVRMKALTDEESDATEMELPCYVHGMLKTESWAGTVRPDKESAKLTVSVPAERRVEQSLLEVRYSPTLAGAMVDALPYMADYPYGCTEQTLNRFLPTVVTQQVLMEMNLDLAAIQEKRTNLNAQEIGDDRERAKQWKRFDRNPVFDRDELDRMVKEGLKRLTSMQNSDGGWGWFSGYAERSWPHTTALIVHGLQVAKQNDVALVPGTLERGEQWLRQYQQQEIQKLKNAEGKITPFKTRADDLDAFVYMVLVDAGSDNQEMREFLYRDRVQLSVYAKAMFGLALEKVGDREKLDMILENISQFVVQDDENDTAWLKLPNEGYWWYWYGSEVEANAYYLRLLARTDAKGQTAPRLVKYLLNNRKHATYWDSTRDTAIVVESFADYLRASGELSPDMVVEVWVDGEKKQEAAINRDNLFTFDNKFVLAGKELTDGSHEVEIRRRGQGPVYFNAYLTNFTLEDDIARAGLEIKVQRAYYRLVREEKSIKVEGERGQPVDQRVEKYRREKLDNLDMLKSGELVEIELEIDSKNDYEYIMFEDMKAAGFEPVELRSGYSNNGLGAYMELRDNRVTFFVRWLARGKHSIAYRMRAEIPGKFSALPTKAEAMYAPELKANSDEIKLRIED